MPPESVAVLASLAQSRLLPAAPEAATVNCRLARLNASDKQLCVPGVASSEKALG